MWKSIRQVKLITVGIYEKDFKSGQIVSPPYRRVFHLPQPQKGNERRPNHLSDKCERESRGQSELTCQAHRVTQGQRLGWGCEQHDCKVQTSQKWLTWSTLWQFKTVPFLYTYYSNCSLQRHHTGNFLTRCTTENLTVRPWLWRTFSPGSLVSVWIPL